MSKFNRYHGGAAIVALVAGMVLAGGTASAQSTGSQQTEETVVVVTGLRVRATAGLIEAETAPKTRSNITAEFLETQAAGQSVAQSLNLLPGVNFVNSDPYGSSGGNIRLRGFDGNRISLTLDGIPLNDTGNYAIFTNQQMDPEFIQRTTVNTGTTDVDSPSASATGGTINIRMRRPDQELGFRSTLSFGQFDYGRVALAMDTGAFGPWGTTAFIGGSYQNYSKFKGPGELEKQQFNARIYQSLRDRDFVSISFHYNQNRNAFYRNLSQSQIDFYGRNFDNLATCTRVAPGAGVRQDENSTPVAQSAAPQFQSTADNVENPSSCTNFFGIRINPSNTGNIRIGSSFQLADNIRLTVDPTYQYVLANGGGTAVINENDRRLRGPGLVLTGTGAISAGVDLNGDGDILDAIRFYTPNTTNTQRFGLNSSLIWDVTDNHRLRLAYTFDRGRHRQTGEWGLMGADGTPEDVFAGRTGTRVVGADGSFLRGRDRLSYAILNQLSVDYNGRFLDDALRINIGIRAPFFRRELNQFCFSQNGSSAVLCTTETPSGTLANGNVTFASTGTTQYIAPYEAVREYDAVLPNIGMSYEFIEDHIIYGSYAEGFSAPRTDNLYTVVRAADSSVLFNSAVPETTQSFDLGYRYQGQSLTASVALWSTTYENRIVTAFDDVLGISVDRNVGNVELQGLDLEVGYRIGGGFTAYASASFNDSELQNDLPLSATTALPLRGRSLVETPEETYAMRIQYVGDVFEFGIQGKYVSDRFATDMNDLVAPAYTVVDLNMTYNLKEIGLGNSEVQLNIINLLNEEYLGNINTTNHAFTLPNVSTVPGVVTPRNGAAPNYSLGAPQTFQLSLRSRF
jgi:iron complex outermembrane recepter protein